MKQISKLKRLAGVLMTIIMLLTLLSACGNTSQKESKQSAVVLPVVATKIFNGKVAKSNIQMTLNLMNDSVYGEYYYTKYKTNILLSGKSSNDSLTINEYTNGKLTGTFNLTLLTDGSLKGYWSNETKKLPVELNELSADAKPFKGEWICDEPGDYDEESGQTFGKYYFSLNLDFYEKTVTYSDKLTHGFHNIITEKHVENSEITSFDIDGNHAKIVYEDGNGNFCSATLIYNPADKSMEFIDGKVIRKAESEEEYGSEEFHLAMDRILYIKTH